MLTETVVKFFGTKADVARATHFTRGAITNWGEVVPETAVWRVEQASRRQLKGDFQFYLKLEEQRRAARPPRKRKRAKRANRSVGG
jgi:hypothetical protein